LGVTSALRQEKKSTLKMAVRSHTDLIVFIRVKYYNDLKKFTKYWIIILQVRESPYQLTSQMNGVFLVFARFLRVFWYS
jgi:hypothetical protein